MAGAINQAEPEDSVVFAEEAISQPTAEQWKKIDANDEGVKDILGRARRAPPPGKIAATT